VVVLLMDSIGPKLNKQLNEGQWHSTAYIMQWQQAFICCHLCWLRSMLHALCNGKQHLNLACHLFIPFTVVVFFYQLLMMPCACVHINVAVCHLPLADLLPFQISPSLLLPLSWWGFLLTLVTQSAARALYVAIPWTIMLVLLPVVIAAVDCLTTSNVIACCRQ